MRKIKLLGSLAKKIAPRRAEKEIRQKRKTGVITVELIVE